jgi:multiple sugar transport system permease protein
VLIIPAQFVLAIMMALVIQARLKGNTLFLYIFAIPLAVSDLAVGILWFSIFTQNGYLNSILQGLGLIDSPVTYLSANSRQWIIAAVWLAEVWRATSIVMIIVVSGLQAISQEVLEAAEIFGATLWQRIRYIILPLLRPSLQVALILRTILALQVFAVVVALSGGDVVTVLANETYRQYSEFRNPNVAAAYATFILLISMVSAVVYLRALRTQEEVVE